MEAVVGFDALNIEDYYAFGVPLPQYDGGRRLPFDHDNHPLRARRFASAPINEALRPVS